MLWIMLQIVITWAILGAAITGLGLLVRPLPESSESAFESLLFSFWLGWALLILGLLLWHLPAGIGISTTGILLAGGLAGILRNRAIIFRHVQQLTGTHRLWALGFFAIALWLANMALAPVYGYDAGHYHLQAVKWYQHYPLVPGLGNLHYTFGYHCSHYLFMAMLESLPIPIPSYRLANGMLLLGVLAHISIAARRLIVRHAAAGIKSVYAVVLLPAVVRQCVHLTPSPYPDLPVFATGIVGSLLLASLLFDRLSARQRRFRASLLLILSVVGITMKLSFLIIGTAFSMAAILLAKERGQTLRQALASRAMRSGMLVALSLMALWVHGNITLSGYPLYPSTAFALSVDWRVPSERAEEAARTIRAWGRRPGAQPDDVMHDWRWLGGWARRNGRRIADVTVPLCLAIVGVALWLVGKKKADTLRAMAFLLPAIAGLAFWFFSSPDPRYAGALPWYLGGGLFASAAARFICPSRPRRAGLFVLCVLLVTIILHYNKQVILLPPLENKRYETPSVPLTTYVTRSGLEVLKPITGDQCWDAPLPCTPVPKQTLRLRQPGSIRHGFTLGTQQAHTDTESRE